MTEKIDYIVNNLVKYQISLDDLKEIAPVINSSDFEKLYEYIEDIQVVFQEEGKLILKNELKEMVENENRKLKISKVIKIKEYRLQAIAVCVLLVCALGIFKVTKNDYNNENFRKSYIQR